MSASTYNWIFFALAGIATVAFLLMLLSLLAIIVRWKSPGRRRHFVQFICLLGVLVLAIGVQQYVQWKILLPSLARQQLEAQEARRVEKDIETSLLRVGDQVPNMTLVTVAGQSITIPNGKPMVINFFATWCGPCLIELPHIEAIWSDLAKDEGMGLVVIGREETEESILKFMETKKFSFPVVADTDSTIFSQFAKSTIPRTYVISPNGKIVYASIGFVESDVDKLKSAIHDQVSLPPSNSMLAE